MTEQTGDVLAAPKPGSIQEVAICRHCGASISRRRGRREWTHPGTTGSARCSRDA